MSIYKFFKQILYDKIHLIIMNIYFTLKRLFSLKKCFRSFKLIMNAINNVCVCLKLFHAREHILFENPDKIFIWFFNIKALKNFEFKSIIYFSNLPEILKKFTNTHI